MTDEDKKLICDYMGWTYHVTDDGKWWNCIGPKGGNHLLDLNDAGLVVAEMQKRGEWVYFYDDLLDTYNGLCEDGKVSCGAENFSAWLFNSENFFNAMSEWLKERGK